MRVRVYVCVFALSLLLLSILLNLVLTLSLFLSLEPRPPPLLFSMFAHQAGTSGTQKRAKTKEPVDDAQLNKLHAEGKLNKLTVPELKAAIEQKGHKPRGKRKADHVEQLDEILSS